MQDSSPPPSGQADSTRLLERIDRLESQLRERRRALGQQTADIEGRLAQFGLDSIDRIIDAYQQLEASQRDALQQPLRPAQVADAAPRATAYRRIGRMV